MIEINVFTRKCCYCFNNTPYGWIDEANEHNNLLLHKDYRNRWHHQNVSLGLKYFL